MTVFQTTAKEVKEEKMSIESVRVGQSLFASDLQQPLGHSNIAYEVNKVYCQ